MNTPLWGLGYTERMKKTFLIPVLLLIAITFVVGYQFGKSGPIESPIATATTTPATSTPVTKKAATTSIPAGLYSFITEKDFVAFAQTAIERRCPFYKPDGATYRSCLSDWEQSLEATVLTEQADEVHAYCSTFTAKYVQESSPEGQELFLKCAIFKLQ